MVNTYVISVEPIEPIEPSGVVLTFAELPGLVIFGETTEQAFGWTREALAFYLRDSREYDKQPPLELVLGRAS